VQAASGWAYIGTVPAQKRVHCVCGEIRKMTGRNTTTLDQETVVARINRTINGRANYFCLGLVCKAYGAVDSYSQMRLRLCL
jgi:RNA-directed DNA polymerase